MSEEIFHCPVCLGENKIDTTSVQDVPEQKQCKLTSCNHCTMVLFRHGLKEWQAVTPETMAKMPDLIQAVVMAELKRMDMQKLIPAVAGLALRDMEQAQAIFGEALRAILAWADLFATMKELAEHKPAHIAPEILNQKRSDLEGN